MEFIRSMCAVIVVLLFGFGRFVFGFGIGERYKDKGDKGNGK